MGNGIISYSCLLPELLNMHNQTRCKIHLDLSYKEVMEVEKIGFNVALVLLAKYSLSYSKAACRIFPDSKKQISD